MDGLVAIKGFLHLYEYARCSSALLEFLGHETPILQTFGEKVECFRLLQPHLCSWWWLARLPPLGPHVCVAALALQSLGFCPAQLEGRVTNCLCRHLLKQKLLGSVQCPGRDLAVLALGTSLFVGGALGTERQCLRGGVKVGQLGFGEDACLPCLYSLCTVSLSR